MSILDTIQAKLKRMFSGEQLERINVKIDIDKLSKSNIKQIIMPLNKVVELNCLDIGGKSFRKSEIFDSCLNNEDANKAKQLNKIYRTRIWNLLDEDVVKDMNFDDFVG